MAHQEVDGFGFAYLILLPNACDQVPADMGQGWVVVNVDLKESVAGGFIVKLGEFFFDDFKELIHSLRIPCLPKEVDNWLSEGEFALQPAPIGVLSVELIDLVFQAVLNDPSSNETTVTTFQTAVNLAVTCKRLLTIGKRHLLARLIALHARYVDCRLICIGQGTSKEDQAPPGMLTAAELHEIATTPADEWDSSANVAVYRRFATFAGYTYRSYKDVMRTLYEPLNQYWRDISDVCFAYRLAGQERPARMKRDMRMIAVLAGGRFEEPAYPAGPAVLCNLSKGEYVREDRLTAGRRNVQYRCTLAHALLSRICWSSSAWFALECGEEYEERFVHGPWAGDRFCITGLEGMPAPRSGEEWVDVTAEADELLCHIWERNCGEDVDEDDASD